MLRERLAGLVPALLVAGLAVRVPEVAAQRAGATLAVATENGLATREALAQMAGGGTAADAAVTAALLGGVVSPTSSGIGGGGFVVVWDAAGKRPFVLDFRETAPAAVDVAAFERRPLPDDERGMLTGTPGEIAGLFELHRRFGRRSWREVVEPAARWARQGFPVERHLASMLASAGQRLRVDPGIDGVFYPAGRPAAVGNLVRNPKLARSLEAIAAGGARAFYEGRIAADVVGRARELGGALTEADLAAYRPVERAPLHARWEGHDVYTMPPPSAGGLMVLQTLGMFRKDELAGLDPDGGAYVHLMAEAMRGAVADRMRWLGDPDHQRVDVAALTSPKRLAARRSRIALDRTHGIPRFGLEEHGTHHLVTADASGSVVCLTTTVNRLFGAKATTADTGVVLNDELDDFTPRASVAAFGMKESPNRARPGARPVSSMTPTIVVKDGEPVLALGGSGGTTIATNVTQLLVGRLVFGKSPAQLVSQRRFYVPTEGAYVSLEAGVPPSLFSDLEARGEIVTTQQFTTSAVQIVAMEGGRKLAAADPRKHGVAATR